MWKLNDCVFKLGQAADAVAVTLGSSLLSRESHGSQHERPVDLGCVRGSDQDVVGAKAEEIPGFGRRQLQDIDEDEPEELE